MEPLLADELQSLGMQEIKLTRAGVTFHGQLLDAYRACLWSRIANRILLPLATFTAPDPDSLYQGIQTVNWKEHFSVDHTFAVETTLLNSHIQHTHFAALKVKDAIVDQFRWQYGSRPSIALQKPDIQLHLHIQYDKATIYLDLSGESLHKRGYRALGVEAPLKENLAAAILIRANWLTMAKQGDTFLDPMCGSGTLPIEAALMAADIAPGLLRHYFGFLQWQQHNHSLWNQLINDAQQRKTEGLTHLPKIIGFDADTKAVTVALYNVEKAGLHGKIHIEKRALAQLTAPTTHGLLVANPPYGERLGNTEELKHLYHFFGETLKNQFYDWQVAVLAGNSELGKHIGIRAKKMYTLYNGALMCKLLRFEVNEQWFMHFNQPNKMETSVDSPRSENGQMFANRLQKNVQKIEKWAKQSEISCYRLYDADLPEYAFAIDRYERWVHVQEYAAPKTIDPIKAQTRLQEGLHIICDILAIDKNHLFVKTRKPQKGKSQYEKQSDSQQSYEVHEGKAIFLVNFTDYLDTGLFLDHRITRQQISQLAAGKHFLNLFAYTGTATVCAALGGAKRTTTVDMSRTYLDWARRNLARNGFSDHKHQFIQADCLTWLQTDKSKYDLIFLDPPTFSNSKRMEYVLDIQRDHVTLIESALQHLNPQGLLIFSTNFQKFKLDESISTHYKVVDWNKLTLPQDFARTPKIHQCWIISRS